ncbi:hypothetical protein EDD22DRAFT_331555 [Suillus occidentalis]|nr:hypothetical protein EDD22DRAFT_331555 [Suillus occidentalis]
MNLVTTPVWCLELSVMGYSVASHCPLCDLCPGARVLQSKVIILFRLSTDIKQKHTQTTHQTNLACPLPASSKLHGWTLFRSSTLPERLKSKHHV